MAPAGRYVPPRQTRAVITHFAPLTCRAGYGTMSTVDRMGGFRGLVIGLFRLPMRSAFFGRPEGGKSAGGRPSPKQSAGRPVRVGSVGREGGVYLYTHPRPTGLPNRQPTAGTTVFSVGGFDRRLVRRPADRDFPTRRKSRFRPRAEGCISRRSSTAGRCRAVRT